MCVNVVIFFLLRYTSVLGLSLALSTPPIISVTQTQTHAQSRAVGRHARAHTLFLDVLGAAAAAVVGVEIHWPLTGVSCSSVG